ncbi:endonuclease III [Lactobacillus hamsteri]|nr:endonuclease III [Lactobacillus hamsteri]
MATKITLNQLYDIMYDHMDPTGWWPGRSDWEVIWSTVLIQNTNWKNVAQALKDLYKVSGFLPQKILTLTDEELTNAIKKAGFYTRKVKTIQNLATYFQKYDFDLELMQEMPKAKLRKELLAIKGIGSETADVILMYGLRKGEFVVDNYSYRLFECLGWKMPKYEKAKQIIEHDLTDFTLRNYQNFHAMIDTFNQEYKLPQDFEKSFLAGYCIIPPKEKGERFTKYCRD